MKPKARKPGQETALNLTPVLSVAFIILLLFVVAAPFMQERGFAVWGINYGHGCEIPTIVIFVDNRNRIFVGDSDRPKQVALQTVRTIVARRLAEKPRCGVLVQAHPHSDMGTVIRVVDQAKLARDPSPAIQIATVESQ